MGTYDDDDEVFDASTVEITDRLIPVCECTLHATQVQVKDGENGWGYNITFEVLSGEHEGRQMWEFYNVRNASEIAQQIGRESLAKLSLAVVTGPFRKHEAEQALCFKPFVGKIGIRQDKKRGCERNAITSYKPLDSAGQTSRPQTAAPQRQQAAQNTQQQEQPAQQRAAAGGGSRPWQRPAR